MSRIALRISLGILFVLVASAIIISLGARHTAEKHFKRHLSELLSNVQEARQRIDHTPAADLDAEVARLKKRLSYPVALLPPDSPKLPAEVRAAARNGEVRTHHVRKKGWVFYVPVRNHSRVLVLGPMGRPRWKDHGPIGLVLAGLLAIIIATGFVVAAPLVKRLHQLERAATRISQGDLEARADVCSKDAVGRLARRFNIMADRVQGLLQSQRQLIQAVSHELRTPVSRIRFGLEMLDSAADAPERAARLASLEEDLDELEQLVGELLLYIRAGDGALQLDRAAVPLADLVEDIARRCGEDRQGVQIRAVSPEPDGVTLDADPRFLRRALRNLLDNALRHAEGRVEVRWERHGDQARILVDDDGPGVPEADRARVLEPFARLEASRNRDSGGAGLGLAIARRVAESHAGHLAVEDAPLGGARFALTWPVAEEDGPGTQGYKAVPKGDGPAPTHPSQ